MALDILKGRKCMVWTFTGNTRMHTALKNYGDRLSQVGLFSFKVDATGTITEPGVAISDQYVATYHMAADCPQRRDFERLHCSPGEHRRRAEAFHGVAALVVVLEKHILGESSGRNIPIRGNAHHYGFSRCKRRAVLRIPRLLEFQRGAVSRKCIVYPVSPSLH